MCTNCCKPLNPIRVVSETICSQGDVLWGQSTLDTKHRQNITVGQLGYEVEEIDNIVLHLVKGADGERREDAHHDYCRYQQHKSDVGQQS